MLPLPSRLDFAVPSCRALSLTVAACAALLASGCRPEPPTSSASAATPPTAAPAIAADRVASDPGVVEEPAADAPATMAEDETIAIDLYTPDAACKGFQRQTVQLPVERPVDAAVGRVLIEVASDNVDLQGYRLRVNSTERTATVDLRIRPGAERKFASLSSCEQLTLFGSVRETLTRNPNWPVETVKFTDGTREIRL